MKAKKTNNGKKGGLLVGKSHEQGGIKVIVTDTDQRVEVEGGEAIITKPAVEKNWKLLSKINQDGGGVPILPPSKAISTMRAGGELAKGIDVEKEHKSTAEKLYNKKITPAQAPKSIAKEHLAENKHYYTKLLEMEKTFNDGGSITSAPNGDYTELKYIDKDGKTLGKLTYIYDTNGAFSVGFDNSELYIDYIEVHKENRGKGIAKGLLKKAISDAKNIGVEVVTLKRDVGGCQYGSAYDTFLKNLYSSVGFVETWNEKDFEESGGEKNICAMHLFVDKQMAKGGGLEPHKEVSASINASLKDVLALDKYKDLMPMEAGMLYNTFKAYDEMDKEEEGMPIYYEDLSPMQKPIFEGLEKKDYIQDWSLSHSFGNSYRYLTPKGMGFVDAVNVRVQTRKAVKQGSDLFPELSAIPELIPVEHPEFEEYEYPKDYQPILWHLNLKEFCHYAENYKVDTRLAGTKAKLECEQFYKYAIIKPLLHADAERNVFLIAVEAGQLPYDKAVEIIKSADSWDESNRFIKELLQYNHDNNYDSAIWKTPKDVYLSSDYFKNNFTNAKAQKWYSQYIIKHAILDDRKLNDYVRAGIVGWKDIEARINEIQDKPTDSEAKQLQKLQNFAKEQKIKLELKGLYVLLDDGLKTNESEEIEENVFDIKDAVSLKSKGGREYEVVSVGKTNVIGKTGDYWVEPIHKTAQDHYNSGGKWASSSDMTLIIKGKEREVRRLKGSLKGYEQNLSEDLIKAEKKSTKKAKENAIEQANAFWKPAIEKAKNRLIELGELSKEDNLKPLNSTSLPKNEIEFVNRYKKDLIDIVNEKISGYNKTKLEGIAKTFDITNQNLVKELGELAVYFSALSISMNGRLNGSEQYDELVELYKAQVSSSHRTSDSIKMQQYSTPIPIGFIAGLFCGINYDSKGDYFESCAGNGLMTVAGNPKNWTVNEIDPIRLKNLKSISYNGEPFKQVLSQDASESFKDLLRRFDAVITNPPFNSIDALKYDPNENFEVKSLEQLIALRTLETMKDDGRGAIIIGGHTEYDTEGRIKAGKNRSFFVYLYKYYNVVDVINISGRHLYARQGTGYDTRLILIDGRKKEPKGFPPLITKTTPAYETNSSAPVTSFDWLWERVSVLLKD